MAKFSPSITQQHRDIIAAQHIFFTATAPLDAQGHINLSPKGLDAFRVIDDNTVGYMDLISSGNETSAHTRENGRITFMFCSFGEKPVILRLYGRGRAVLPGTPDWESHTPLFTIYPSTRQLIIAEIHLVQTSCGFGVPMYSYTGERDQHHTWAASKGPDGLRQYLEEKNLVSIDGLKTDWGAEQQK